MDATRHISPGSTAPPDPEIYVTQTTQHIRADGTSDIEHGAILQNQATIIKLLQNIRCTQLKDNPAEEQTREQEAVLIGNSSLEGCMMSVINKRVARWASTMTVHEARNYAAFRELAKAMFSFCETIFLDDRGFNFRLDPRLYTSEEEDLVFKYLTTKRQDKEQHLLELMKNMA